MIEYVAIEVEDHGPNYLTTVLNSHARDGWRLVCSIDHMLILEREKQPRIEENATENSRSVTYSWDFFKD